MEWYNFNNTEPDNLQEVKVKRVVGKISEECYTEEKIISFNAIYFIDKHNNKWFLVYKFNKLEGWIVEKTDIWSPIEEENETIETEKD